MRVIGKEILHRSPGKGTLVYWHTFYTRATGFELLGRRMVETRSDLIDSVDEAFSPDNGKTWSPFTPRPVVWKTAAGMKRHFPMPSFIDPVNGALVTVLNEGILPNDDVIADGMRQYYLRYRVSLDGGRSNTVDEVVTAPGRTHESPFEGITVGKNSIMLGDNGSEPLRTRSGRLLVPVQVCPVGPDGEYYNPGGGYTYHDAAVLIGEWCEGHRIRWRMSDYVRNDPQVSTRGCVEPTLAQFPDGRILMVCRGSNDVKPHLPGYKWFSVSHDEGDTWSPVKPWTCSDGSHFFSPSSMSQLLRHPNGHTYWLGNLTPENPRGNGPRYPLVIGRIDPVSLGLIRESVVTIDTRGEHDPPDMTLSNFYARLDRATGDILVHVSRWLMPEWIGDAYVYRIAP